MVRRWMNGFEVVWHFYRGPTAVNLQNAQSAFNKYTWLKNSVINLPWGLILIHPKGNNRWMLSDNSPAPKRKKSCRRKIRHDLPYVGIFNSQSGEKRLGEMLPFFIPKEMLQYIS